jgi:hypothetical protein
MNIEGALFGLGLLLLIVGVIAAVVIACTYGNARGNYRWRLRREPPWGFGYAMGAGLCLVAALVGALLTGGYAP